MSEDRFSKLPDLTDKQPGKGTGHSILRLCFKCNKPKLERGGALNKRTRMWSCAACHQKANPCSSSV